MPHALVYLCKNLSLHELVVLLRSQPYFHGKYYNRVCIFLLERLEFRVERLAQTVQEVSVLSLGLVYTMLQSRPSS